MKKTSARVVADRLRAFVAAVKHEPDKAPGEILLLPRANRVVAMRSDLAVLAGIRPSRVSAIIDQQAVARYAPRWIDVESFADALEISRFIPGRPKTEEVSFEL